jgi:hypothetical protein
MGSAMEEVFSILDFARLEIVQPRAALRAQA